MKKSVIIAVLGISSYAAFAQGHINFTSYAANDTAGFTTTLFGSGGNTTVPSSFTAQLYYAIGTVNDPVDTGSASSVLSAPAAGLTLFSGVNAPFTSVFGSFQYFNWGQLDITGYSSGPITFEVVATGTIAGTPYFGRSGSYVMNNIPAGVTAAPTPALGDAGFGNASPFPNMVVASVPEPSTLALAGLGGFGMLMALRRKKA